MVAIEHCWSVSCATDYICKQKEQWFKPWFTLESILKWTQHQIKRDTHTLHHSVVNSRYHNWKKTLKTCTNKYQLLSSKSQRVILFSFNRSNYHPMNTNESGGRSIVQYYYKIVKSRLGKSFKINTRPEINQQNLQLLSIFSYQTEISQWIVNFFPILSLLILVASYPSDFLQELQLIPLAVNDF